MLFDSSMRSVVDFLLLPKIAQFSSNIQHRLIRAFPSITSEPVIQWLQLMMESDAVEVVCSMNFDQLLLVMKCVPLLSAVQDLLDATNSGENSLESTPSRNIFLAFSQYFCQLIDQTLCFHQTQRVSYPPEQSIALSVPSFFVTLSEIVSTCRLDMFFGMVRLLSKKFRTWVSGEALTGLDEEVKLKLFPVVCGFEYVEKTWCRSRMRGQLCYNDATQLNVSRRIFLNYLRFFSFTAWIITLRNLHLHI